MLLLNPLTLVSDQDRISPYSVKKKCDKKNEKYQLGIIGWSHIKFSELSSKELYGGH